MNNSDVLRRLGLFEVFSLATIWIRLAATDIALHLFPRVYYHIFASNKMVQKPNMGKESFISSSDLPVFVNLVFASLLTIVSQTTAFNGR